MEHGLNFYDTIEPLFLDFYLKKSNHTDIPYLGVLDIVVYNGNNKYCCYLVDKNLSMDSTFDTNESYFDLNNIPPYLIVFGPNGMELAKYRMHSLETRCIRFDMIARVTKYGKIYNIFMQGLKEKLAIKEEEK